MPRGRKKKAEARGSASGAMVGYEAQPWQVADVPRKFYGSGSKQVFGDFQDVGWGPLKCWAPICFVPDGNSPPSVEWWRSVFPTPWGGYK